MWTAFQHSDFLKMPPTKKPCFLAGTPVRTSSGVVPIEHMERGMVVMAFDRESYRVVPSRVTEVYRNRAEKYVEIRVGGECIRATGAHVFYSFDEQTWQPASRLTTSHRLTAEDGSAVPIQSVEHVDAEVETYNLEVDGLNTYYVGANTSVLTHNASRTFRYDDPTEYEFKHYKLLNRNTEARYVGLTVHDEIGVRLAEHMTEGRAALRGRKPQYLWKSLIKGILQIEPEGLRPGNNRMTFFEARVIEKYEMERLGGLKKLENRSNPMSKRSFDHWKKKGGYNPCRFYV